MLATGEAEITVLETQRAEAGLASAMAVVPFEIWRQPWLPDGHLTSTYLPCTITSTLCLAETYISHVSVTTSRFNTIISESWTFPLSSQMYRKREASQSLLAESRAKGEN